MPSSQPLIFRIRIAAGESRSACELLAQGTGLSKTRIKDAMQKGAVWLARRGSGEQRLRRASAMLRSGDELALFYDAHRLAQSPPAADCRRDEQRYSVWFKPAGLLTQGTRFGDHCSLLRQAETFLRPARRAFLIHRLDREAAGLVLIAHDRPAAAALSKLFADRRIVKRYRVEVHGRMEETEGGGRIELPLDGKPALTEYTVKHYDPAADASLLEAILHTGRRHQLRRHLAQIGHAVLGDPAYGPGSSHRSDLKLTACGLEFICPFSGKTRRYQLEPAS